MKTEKKNEMRIILRSRWWWAFMICGGLSIITMGSLFLPPPLNGLNLWVRVAEWFYGDLDAPDNWALGVTCCVKVTTVLLVITSVMGVVAVLKTRGMLRTMATTST